MCGYIPYGPFRWCCCHVPILWHWWPLLGVSRLGIYSSGPVFDRWEEGTNVEAEEIMMSLGLVRRQGPNNSWPTLLLVWIEWFQLFHSNQMIKNLAGNKNSSQKRLVRLFQAVHKTIQLNHKTVPRELIIHSNFGTVFRSSRDHIENWLFTKQDTTICILAVRRKHKT